MTSRNWRNRRVFVGEAFGRELIGLSPVDDRHWRVQFGPIALGVLDGHECRLLTPAQTRRVGLDETIGQGSLLPLRSSSDP